MPVLNISFTKMIIERSGVLKPTDQINNSLKIEDVEKEKVQATESKSVLRFKFSFEVKYSTAGHALLEGNLTFLEDTTKIDKVYKEYKEDKKLPQEIKTQVYNSLLYKCNLKVLSLSEDVSLPPHFNLPYVKTDTN